MTNPAIAVRRLGDGLYAVEHDGRTDLVYVAGKPPQQWAFWNGHVYRGSQKEAITRRGASRSDTPQSITAPMPATVVKVLVQPGASVKKGETVVILEAMKMELPIRAPADGTVLSVRCRERELVQPDTVLLDVQ